MRLGELICAAGMLTGTCTMGVSAMALVMSTARRIRRMPGAAGGAARRTWKITWKIWRMSLPGSAASCRNCANRALMPGRLLARETGPEDAGRSGGVPASKLRAGSQLVPAAAAGRRRTRQRSAIVALLSESARFRTARDLHQALGARGRRPAWPPCTGCCTRSPRPVRWTRSGRRAARGCTAAAAAGTIIT